MPVAAPLLMFVVALLAAGCAAWFLLRRTTSDASVYRNRIAGTMFASLAAILIIFAWSIRSWVVS